MITNIEQKQTKHDWLKTTLRHRINNMQDGQQFTAELELCKEFNLSRMTVNKVIMELVRDGLLLRKRPVGTFVSKETINKNIGLIMPGLGMKLTLTQSPTHYLIFDGIQKFCIENSMDLQIMQRKYDAFSWEKISRSNISGLIIVLPRKSEYKLISELKEHQIPFLCINLHSEKINQDVNFVNIDFYNAAFDAVSYLSEKGKRNIAVVSTYKIKDDTHPFHVINGYKHSIKRLGLKENIITADTNDEQLQKCDVDDFFKANLEKIKKYDAVITTDHQEALSLSNILNAEKIKIPESISLISFFNDEVNKKAGITSYDPDLQMIGYKSSVLLNEALNDNKIKQLKIKPKLFIRRSA